MFILITFINETYIHITKIVYSIILNTLCITLPYTIRKAFLIDSCVAPLLRDVARRSKRSRRLRAVGAFQWKTEIELFCNCFIF